MPVALAGPAAVAAALMALALLWGIILLVDALDKAIERSPIPGWIGDALKWVTARLTDAVNAISGFLSWVIRGGLSIFTAPAMALLTLISSIAVGFARTAGWLRWVIYSAIPNLWNNLYAEINKLADFLVRYASGLFGQAIAFTQAVRAELYRAISAALSAAQQFAYTLYVRVSNALASAFAALTNLAYGLFWQAMSALAKAVANLINFALNIRQQLIAYAIQLAQWAVASAVHIATDWAKRYADQLLSLYNQALTAATALAVAPAWPKVIDAVDAISLALPESVAAVLARIGVIPRAIPRDVAASIGAVAAVSAVAVDWVADCGVPLCRNLRGFGNEIAALEDAALMAVVIGMVIDAMEDPNGSANRVHDTIGAELRSTVDGAFSLLTSIA